MTWKPTAGMTARQIEKELNRQAVMFEEACMNGQIVTAVKFEDFARASCSVWNGKILIGIERS